MTIGRVAARAGVSVDTLRFYERRGLIARPRRSLAGYRDYAEDVVERLGFIRDAKALGFSLREIGELLSLGVTSTRECGPVTRKAEAKLAGIREDIRRLNRLRRTLEKIISDCEGDCGGACSGSCTRCGSRRRVNPGAKR